MADVITSYKDLRVWAKSLQLADDIYSATELFPKREWYGLANQMRRAAVSVPSNIAEGSVRGSKEFAHFLAIARGSLAELETQILIAAQRKYLEEEMRVSLLEKISDISPMLMALSRSIHSKTPSSRNTKHEALSA